MQINVITHPKLEKPPTGIQGQDPGDQSSIASIKRIRLLREKPRLDQMIEGAKEVKQICKEYANIFKLPGDMLTTTTAAEHSNPTPSISKGRAIILRNYRMPEAQQKVKEQIDQMLLDEVIVPSKSQWNFPLIVVPKKIDASGKNKWRICIDFRKLNEVTIGDSYPLPNIQDILVKLGKARYFSAIDCASGYLQALIAEDRQKNAFSTADGHFEYTRMPSGLKAAPSTFQRMMNSISSELIGNNMFSLHRRCANIR
jgi:hypothetical protein